MSGTVVIGFDASDASEDALALGLLIAHATGDRPLVAAVYPEEYESGMGRVDAEYVAFMREQADEMLARARRVLGDEPSVGYRRVGSSSAAHGLDALAEQVRHHHPHVGRQLLAGEGAQVRPDQAQRQRLGEDGGHLTVRQFVHQLLEEVVDGHGGVSCRRG